MGSRGFYPNRRLKNSQIVKLRVNSRAKKSCSPALAARMADAILARGVYVRAFSYPVVPRDKARIRTQLSASLTGEDLDKAIEAFVEARAEVA